jgi:hypothetical protein
MKLKSIFTAGVLTLATLVSTQASAVIMSMDFSTKSGWLADGVNSTTKLGNTVSNCNAGATNALNNCGLTFINAEAAIADGYKTVNWGSASTFSGLDIVSNSGTLITNGGWVQTGLITHRNRPIPNTTRPLQSLDLKTMFSIVSPFAFGPVPASVGVEFRETPNSTNLASCPTPQISAVGCDDTFKINLTTSALTFQVGPQNYRISFKLSPLNGVTSITNPDGTITLVTAENATNQMEFLARLETIPAPATIGILGLSLVLLSMRRHKKSA